mmetsp:Transcript_13711/g.32111  ORF Transcript_13711/g.32111 Transcript_13711/m.32111 type:complete len:336 (+) Transcript_13711:3000-4007(+)
MVGQMVLNHSIGGIQKVGHAHHFDRLFHVGVEFVAGFVEVHHIQHGSTDHCLHVFWVHVHGSLECGFGAIHLSQSIAGQSKSDTGRRPALGREKPDGLGIHALGPLVFLFQVVDGRQSKKCGKDLPTLIEGGFKEKPRLVQPVSRQTEHPPSHPGHWVEVVEAAALGKPVLRLGDQILPHALFFFANLLGGSQVSYPGRGIDPELVALLDRLGLVASRFQYLGRVLRVLLVLDVVEGGIGPDTEIRFLVFHHLQNLGRLGFGNFLRKHLDEILPVLPVARDRNDQRRVILVFDQRGGSTLTVLGWRNRYLGLHGGFVFGTVGSASKLAFRQERFY